MFETRDRGASWAARGEGLPPGDAYLTVLRQAFGHDGRAPIGLYFGAESGEVFGSVGRRGDVVDGGGAPRPGDVGAVSRSYPTPKNGVTSGWSAFVRQTTAITPIATIAAKPAIQTSPPGLLAGPNPSARYPQANPATSPPRWA